MKKLLFIFLILQGCTTKVLVVNSSSPKILFFLKHSEESNDVNKAKLNHWVKDLQIRYPNLYFIGKSFNVNSSLSFDEQLKIRVQETKTKYVFSYSFVKHNTTRKRDKHIFVLSDSNKVIKDRVYHNFVLIRFKDIKNDFSVLESLK